MRPRWWPVWLRRAFPGRWTQAEVDDINRRAAERYDRIRHLIDDGRPDQAYASDDGAHFGDDR